MGLPNAPDFRQHRRRMPTASDLVLPPLIAFVLAAALGLGLALLRARRRGPGWIVLDAAVLLPAFVPVPALATVLIAALPQSGFLSMWIVAAGLSAAAFAYVPALIALRRVATSYHDTARVLGLGAFARFTRIVAPLTWPAFALGKLLALTRVVGEWLSLIGSIDNLTVLLAGMLALALAAAVATGLALHRLRPLA